MITYKLLCNIDVSFQNPPTVMYSTIKLIDLWHTRSVTRAKYNATTIISILHCDTMLVQYVLWASVFLSVRPSTTSQCSINYKNKNWLQFLFIVKAAVLKQQISKFYPQIQRTEASDHIYFSQRPFINVKAIFCA